MRAARGDDAPLHSIVRGAGDATVVFLHYFGGSSRSWSGVIDRLEGTVRCVALDLRGYGGSAAAPGGYTIEDSADDVQQLAHRLQLDRYTLVGHSMGGKIALALAARAPAALQSLVLVAPSPPTAEPIAAADRARLLRSHGNRASARHTARTITAQPLGRIAMAHFVEDSIRTAPAAWRAWLARESRIDITAAMPNVRLPVLVVGGARDPVIPVRLLAREVVPRVAGARLTVIPDAGHLMPIETPDAVARLIRSHLLDIGATGMPGMPGMPVADTG